MPSTNTEPKTNNTRPQLISSEQFDDLVETVTNVSENAVESSKKAVDSSVKFAKEYPLHTALGAGVLGFVAGYVSNMMTKES